MAEPYIGEIRQFAGNYAPEGWMLCNGATLPVSAYMALYTLIGNIYGGTPGTTFNIPNLQGRVPIHIGTNQTQTYPLGNTGGAETVTLTESEIPAHSHTPMASATSTGSNPLGAVWATAPAGTPCYGPATDLLPMNPVSVIPVGLSLPHQNMIPYQTITYIIALEGLWPPNPNQ